MLLGVPFEEFSFKQPGSTSNARWMSSLIYSLKIYFFRKHFKITEEDQKRIAWFCLFDVKVYVDKWIKTPNSLQAPKNDLDFFKDCYDFQSIDPEISQATVKKMLRHTQYLNQ